VYDGNFLLTGGFGTDMPLSKKGSKIKRKMRETYGKNKGSKVFYASINAGKIKGTKKTGRRKNA